MNDHKSMEELSRGLNVANRSIPWSSTWRHKKTDGIYVVTSLAYIEATMEIGVMYNPSNSHGVHVRFIRPMSEFLLKFERVT